MSASRSSASLSIGEMVAHLHSVAATALAAAIADHVVG